MKTLIEMEAIVVRAVDYGESDRIVGFLTADHGKLSAFAPSARKSQRRFPGLDLFAHLQARLRPPRNDREGLWRLESIELIDPHIDLRKDVKRLALAGYLAECLWALGGEGDPQRSLFDWWKSLLPKIASDVALCNQIARFDLELLALCGYAPRWNVCFDCGKVPSGEKLFFSFDRGGVACSRCRARGDGMWLSTLTVDRLKEGNPLAQGESQEIVRVVDAFVRHTLGRELKSQRFREEIFRENG